jgi:hypothetical protein
MVAKRRWSGISAEDRLSCAPLPGQPHRFRAERQIEAATLPDYGARIIDLPRACPLKTGWEGSGTKPAQPQLFAWLPGLG